MNKYLPYILNLLLFIAGSVYGYYTIAVYHMPLLLSMALMVGIQAAQYLVTRINS